MSVVPGLIISLRLALRPLKQSEPVWVVSAWTGQRIGAAAAAAAERGIID